MDNYDGIHPERRKLIPNWKFEGLDEWSRPIYVSENGTRLVDLDGELYTITEFGEPCSSTGVPTSKLEAKAS